LKFLAKFAGEVGIVNKPTQLEDFFTDKILAPVSYKKLHIAQSTCRMYLQLYEMISPYNLSFSMAPYP
jgi:hypothetical protein